MGSAAPADSRLTLSTGALVVLFVGLLFWNDVAQWTDVSTLPLGIVLPLALLAALLPMGICWPLAGGKPLVGALVAFLTLGAIATWRGWATPDLALHQAQMSVGGLWLVILGRLLPVAQVSGFVRGVALFGTPVVAGRMVAHSVQHLAHTPGELRVLHSESDVVGAAVCLMILLVYAEQFRHRALLFLLMAANAVVLLATFKRSAGMGLMAVGALYVWLKGRDKLPPAVRALGVIGLLLALGVLFALSSSPALTEYVATRLDMRTSSSALWRFAAWGDAVELWQSGPRWLGVGYGHQPISILLDYSQHTLIHNSPLALLLHMGAPGVAAFAAMFWISMARALQLWRGDDPAARDVAFLSILASAFLLIFSSFNPALETLNSGIFMWLFLALPLAVPPPLTPSPGTRVTGVAMSLLIGAALVWVGVPKSITAHTLYGQEAGGKLPYATYDGNVLESPLRRGDAVTLIPAAGSARLGSLAWTWLMPESVALAHQSLAHTVLRVTYNHPPSHRLAYNLLDKEGNALTGLRVSQTGRVHEIFVGELTAPAHFFIISDIHDVDPTTTIERVEVRAR